MYNMYAIARNRAKFEKRDRRKIKIQHIETDPLAPDTIQEIEAALRKLIELTAGHLLALKNEKALAAKNKTELYQVAKDFLHQNPDASFTLKDNDSQKKFGAIVLKPVKAYKAYRRIVKFFAVRTLTEYCDRIGRQGLSYEDIRKISDQPLYANWVNVGGQIISESHLTELFDLIKNNSIDTWQQVHEFYDSCQTKYEEYKVAYALNLLEKLYSRPITDFNKKVYDGIIEDVKTSCKEMCDAILASRKKDYDDVFRRQTYRNTKEMEAVIGNISDNEFIRDTQERSLLLEKKVDKLFADFIED